MNGCGGWGIVKAVHANCLNRINGIKGWTRFRMGVGAGV